jgi:hypothetical protein
LKKLLAIHGKASKATLAGASRQIVIPPDLAGMQKVTRAVMTHGAVRGG